MINYYNQYLYLSKTTYENIFGDYKTNSYLIKLNAVSTKKKNDFDEEYISKSEIASIISNEDMKKSMNDMLIEKENYQYKIQQLTAENDKFKSNCDSLKKKISEDEIKRGKVKTSSSQTESLIDQKTKELLLNMKISLNDIIMNRDAKIMNQ